MTKEKRQATNLPRKKEKFNYGIMQTGELEADFLAKILGDSNLSSIFNGTVTLDIAQNCCED